MATVLEREGVSDAPGEGLVGAPPVIEVEDIHMGYEGREIIGGLNLAVTPGQVYGLIGPSGGGKTTLLRAALGLLEPQDGEVRLFGYPAMRLPQRVRARIGYMPQSFTLYPNLTVGENLDFVAGLYGMGLRSRRRRIRQPLERS